MYKYWAVLLERDLLPVHTSILKARTGEGLPRRSVERTNAVLSLTGHIKLTRPSFHTEPIHTNAGRLASERVDREEASLPQVQQHLRRAYTRGN